MKRILVFLAVGASVAFLASAYFLPHALAWCASHGGPYPCNA